MIQISINPGGVGRVLIIARTELEERFDSAAWEAIRLLVKKIDVRLKRELKAGLVSAQRESKGS